MSMRILTCLIGMLCSHFFAQAASAQTDLGSKQQSEIVFMNQFERLYMKKRAAIGYYDRGADGNGILREVVVRSMDAQLSEALTWNEVTEHCDMKSLIKEATGCIVLKYTESRSGSGWVSLPISKGRVVYLSVPGRPELDSSVDLEILLRRIRAIDLGK